MKIWYVRFQKVLPDFHTYSVLCKKDFSCFPKVHTFSAWNSKFPVPQYNYNIDEKRLRPAQKDSIFPSRQHYYFPLIYALKGCRGGKSLLAKTVKQCTHAVCFHVTLHQFGVILHVKKCVFCIIRDRQNCTLNLQLNIISPVSNLFWIAAQYTRYLTKNRHH